MAAMIQIIAIRILIIRRIRRTDLIMASGFDLVLNYPNSSCIENVAVAIGRLRVKLQVPCQSGAIPQPNLFLTFRYAHQTRIYSVLSDLDSTITE
jgi:hypothetical protein